MTHRSLLLAVAAPLCFAFTSAAASAEAASDKDKANEKVCKKDQRTGTRFQSKICYTRAQWEEIEEKAKRDAREFIDQPVANPRSE
jgi:hypothetical protein